MRSKWKLWLLLLVLFLGLGGLVITKLQSQPELKSANAGVQAVETALAEVSERQNVLQFTGTIDAVEKNLISARVAGIVENMPVDNGDPIKAGQTLLQIDD